MMKRISMVTKNNTLRTEHFVCLGASRALEGEGPTIAIQESIGSDLRVHRLAALIIVLGLSLMATVALYSQTNTHSFTVQSYLGLCLSSGDTSNVYIAACKTPVIIGQPRKGASFCPQCTSVSQTVTVEEIDSDHEVRLRMGGRVIGVTGSEDLDGLVLELQSPATTPSGIRMQTFALDGDSIIVSVWSWPFL